MTRLVPLVEYADLKDPKAIAVYDEILAELGFGIVPNLFKSMASRPDFLEANWKHFRGTVLNGSLPRTLKEMVGIAISQHNNSEYALKVHLHGLSALGISEEVLQTLVSDFENCPLPDRQKSVIRFGLAVATNPLGVLDSDVQHMQDLGFSADEIYEVIAAAHLFSGVNIYTDSIRLQIDSL